MWLTPWANRVDAFIGARTRRAIVAVALVWIIYALVKVYADNWLSSAIVSPFVAWFQKAAAIPMGDGLFALLVLLMVLVVVAFVDTSPNAAVLSHRLAQRVEQKPVVTSLSAEDRIEVERVRELWNVDHVGSAVRDLGTILDRAAAYFDEEGNPFAYLLRDPTRRMRESHKAVDEALAEKPQNLLKVQNALKTFNEEYALAACRLNRIRFVDPTFPDEKPGMHELEGWRRSHPAIATMYSTLEKREAFERANIGTLAFDPDAIVFQGEYDFRVNVITSRARVVGERLALISDHEEAFLRLFGLDTLPMDRDNPASFLPNEVFRAGEALVSEKVLNSALVRPGVWRFCLPREARRTWPIPTGFEHECIEIDLATVKGTGSSGGGARASSSLSELGKALSIPGYTGE